MAIKQSKSISIEIGNSFIALQTMINKLRKTGSLLPCQAGKRLFYLDWELKLYSCYTFPEYGSLFDFELDKLEHEPCDACHSQCFRDNSVYYPVLADETVRTSFKAWVDLLSSSYNPFR